MFLVLSHADFCFLFLPSQIPCLRPRQYAGLAKSQRTVSRAYGGSRCAGCVRNRYVVVLWPIPMRFFSCECTLD
jgi:hypothetical protein